MRIRNNGPASRSYRSYRTNSGALSGNLEKLSTGYKINRAGDDAAGLAISEKMRAQINGLEGAQQNAKQGIGLVQVTEGALQEYHEILNRMLELSVQSANSTYEDNVDREELQKEMNRLAQELNRISDSTNFNGAYPLNGANDFMENDASLHSADGDTQPVLIETQEGSDAQPAETRISFPSQTGEDMMGAVLLFGANGEYGKYQFVENESDAKDGYAPIVIEPSFTGDDIALAVYEVTAEADIPSDYVPSLGASEISFEGSVADEQAQDKEAEPLQVSLFSAPEAAEESARRESGAPWHTSDIPLLIGETGEEHNYLDMPAFDMHADRIGLADADISSQDSALDAIDKIKTAINNVSDVRGTYGALQNRLEHTVNYLGNARENMQDAESVIRDTDMAAEMMKYTKNNILTQSSQSMLAQANMLPEGALRLLQ